MTEFYTNVEVDKGRILYRGYRNGHRVQERLNYSPILYTEKKSATDAVSLYGDNLQEHTFGSISDARNFLKEFREVSNAKIYGNSNWNYDFVAKNFRGEITYDMDTIRLVSIDIETTVNYGFPNTMEALEEVLLITVKDFKTKKVITLGSREVDDTVSNYYKCKDEYDLLEKFIRVIKQLDPDIITGWNVVMFDIAYLGSRILKLLGEEKLASLSPWGKCNRRDIEINDKVEITYQFTGIAILDLLDLYKKFTFVTRENYKLDTIAEVELGQNKLENPYETFKEFYEKDFTLFTKYNQRDVDLVDDLEQKLGLIFLAVTLAYISKVNFTDVYSPVKTWECYILSSLADENIYAPVKSRTDTGKDTQFEGAYVKQPTPGMYDWVVSFDATSLYPSIIMMLNMSPETIQPYAMPVDVLPLLSGNCENIFPELRDKNIAMAANGACFSKDKQGILPKLTRQLFEGRKSAKNKMLAAKQKYIDTGDVKYKKESDLQGVMQLAMKVHLNSLFGATGNQWFQFFDLRLAEGITKTGQYIIQQVEKTVNESLNKICKTTNHDYAFYGDTDSIYITLNKIVEQFYPDKSTEEVVDLVDKICEQKLTQIIAKGTDALQDNLNAFERTISFKREAIADRGFWVAKKKYALRVYDNEHVRYKEPDLKVMGIEIVRSSTPSVVREWLKESLPLILDNDIDTLRKYVNKRKSDFNSLPPEAIAFPRSANNLAKYSDAKGIYVKGCPINVRAALVYNNAILQAGLSKKYELINEGDKIKYLHMKLPNTLHENIFAFISKFPKELDIDRYIDYNTQFEKTYMAPLDIILEACSIQLEEQASLGDFFA